MTVLITLTTAGTDVGPFDLYSDVDGYTSSFQTGVSKAILVAGYICTIVPYGTTIIKVQSYGICTNDIYLNVTDDVTTTTTSSSTSSSTSTTTTTTTSYCQSIGAGSGCFNWNFTAGVGGAVVQWTNCNGTPSSSVLGGGDSGSACLCDGQTPSVTSGSLDLITQVGQCEEPTTTTTSTTTATPTTTTTSTTTATPTTTTTSTTTATPTTTTTSTSTAAPTTTTTTSTSTNTTTSTTTSVPLSCPPISNTIRLATLADVGVIPNASVGDLIVFGPNDANQYGPGLYLKNTNTDIETLAPGAKILIRGGYQYSFIGIDTNLAGTLENPIVITNFCGQVETKTFSIIGMSYFKLTGKYDPANKTGDINYQGHAAGYAWSQGKYGIFINVQWVQEGQSLLSINSGIPIGSSVISRTDNYEVEYVESGNGGYSNAFRWDDNNTAYILDNIRIHDNYFHDIKGEAIYMGVAAPSKAGYEIFENLKVYNNRILRCGNESIQIKRIGTGTEIYNNASVNTGLNCQDSQNFATVLWPVNGNTSVNNNLFVGSPGYSAVQWYIVKEPQYTPSATTASFVRNAMLHLGVDETQFAGATGFFMKGFDEINNVNTPNVPPIAQEISNNYWGFFDSTFVVKVVDNYYTAIPTSPIYARDNTYTQKNTFWGGPAPTIDSNNVNGTVNDVSFVNFDYGADFDWSRFRFWDNYAGLNNYTPGWYVSHKSRIYKAIANSTNIEPGVTAGWATYWELKTYNGGLSYLPADDIRVATGNFYNTNNIGLLDNP
jgi:hypothetical protein